MLSPERVFLWLSPTRLAVHHPSYQFQTQSSRSFFLVFRVNLSLPLPIQSACVVNTVSIDRLKATNMNFSSKTRLRHIVLFDTVSSFSFFLLFFTSGSILPLVPAQTIGGLLFPISLWNFRSHARSLFLAKFFYLFGVIPDGRWICGDFKFRNDSSSLSYNFESIFSSFLHPSHSRTKAIVPQRIQFHEKREFLIISLRTEFALDGKFFWDEFIGWCSLEGRLKVIRQLSNTNWNFYASSSSSVLEPA